MPNDRRTTIHGDQIEDRSILERELDIVNTSEILDKKVLGYDLSSGKLKWLFLTDIATPLNVYQSSEGESSTTATAWQDKLSYTINNLPAGNYEFLYYIEYLKVGGALQKVRFIIDDTEYCYDTGEASFTNWNSASGLIRLNFASEANHTIKIQFASGTNNRQVNVRRARLKAFAVGS